MLSVSRTSRVIAWRRRALVKARRTALCRSSSLITSQWSRLVCRKPSTPDTGVRSSWETTEMNSSCERLSSSRRASCSRDWRSRRARTTVRVRPTASSSRTRMRPAVCRGPARGSTNSERSWVNTTCHPTTGTSAATTSLSPISCNPCESERRRSSGTGAPSPVLRVEATTAPLLSRNRQVAVEFRSPASPRISWLNDESLVSACSKTKAPRTLLGVLPLMATAKA